MPKMARWCGYS